VLITKPMSRLALAMIGAICHRNLSDGRLILIDLA
jgi:hypothetical protein